MAVRLAGGPGSPRASGQCAAHRLALLPLRAVHGGGDDRRRQLRRPRWLPLPQHALPPRSTRPLTPPCRDRHPAHGRNDHVPASNLGTDRRTAGRPAAAGHRRRRHGRGLPHAGRVSAPPRRSPGCSRPMWCSASASDSSTRPSPTPPSPACPGPRPAWPRRSPPRRARSDRLSAWRWSAHWCQFAAHRRSPQLRPGQPGRLVGAGRMRRRRVAPRPGGDHPVGSRDGPADGRVDQPRISRTERSMTKASLRRDRRDPRGLARHGRPGARQRAPARGQ